MRTRLQAKRPVGKRSAAGSGRYAARAVFLAAAAVVVVTLACASGASSVSRQAFAGMMALSFWSPPVQRWQGPGAAASGGSRTALAAEETTVMEEVPIDQLIRVRQMGNESGDQKWFFVQFEENETLGDLKEIIEGQTGVEIKHQDLKVGDPMAPQRTLYGETKFLKDIEPPFTNMSAEVWLFDRRVPRRRPMLEIEDETEEVQDTLGASTQLLSYGISIIMVVIIGGQILERWLFADEIPLPPTP